VGDFYEYLLKNVSLSCPVAANAPEQAFKLTFDNITWMNVREQTGPEPITAAPAKLPPASSTGESRSFVITWMAAATDNGENQCDRMNTKPAQADYYALMTPERAGAARKALERGGGVSPEQLPYRGPGELNATLLPGIVPDPGLVSPQANVVRGFDLDGDRSVERAQTNTGTHRSFVSPEGLSGIDNQLFTIEGCIEGWRRNGFLPMISNELRRAGGLSILIDISGIDDPRNDEDVFVTVLYSADPMRRSGASKTVIPDYTYRISSSVEYSQDFARFRAKIIDGVVETEVIPAVYIHEGPSGIGWTLHQPRLRLTINADGTMTGLMGGYRDWREYLAAAFFRSSDYENTIGYQIPGMYNAVRRAADGLLNNETGELEGISAAYDLEGIPAFIPPTQRKRLLAGGPFKTSASHSARFAGASSAVESDLNGPVARR
jgi:hypothetical protein